MEMPETWIIVLHHQSLFQGMVFLKNVSLHKKLGKPIRGYNPEATASVEFFAVFIVVALGIRFFDDTVGQYHLVDETLALIVAIMLMLINLVVSLVSLVHQKDSWRVRVLEDQKTV